ncbi:MAG: recombinase family protein [Clostridia bacterium]|nr:recombinase family protein [Clostridia bacterium]
MKEYKAGIYLRLSHEDISENNSIEAQRTITTEYAKKNKYNVVEEYVDNGYSGMLSSRPAFNRMIVDILNNKINMVIVKDISRLTRDKNKTGYYTEIFFPDNDIRFISVTEMIDSGDRYEIDDSIMFRGLVNQYYVADISKKIKSVKTNRKKNGEFVEHKVPYGYKKDEDDKYKVVFDTNVCENVKLIYAMYLQGFSQSQIAKHLTNLKMDTPKKYKGENCKINEWRNDTISRILKDPFYMGKLIINKYVTEYRTKKTKLTPKEKWILVDGKHEALISEDDFKLVQQKLEHKYKKPEQKYEYLLKGLVYCGYCNSRMQYKYRARTKVRNKVIENPVRHWYYKCRMIYKFPSICDKGHTISEEALNEIVLNSLKKRLSKFKIDEYTGDIIDEYKKVNANFKLLNQYEKKKSKIENSITNLYNKKLEGVIQLEEFKEQYCNLKQELKSTEEQILGLKKNCKTCELDENVKQIIIDFKNGKELDNEIIKILINRIKVYEGKTVDITFNI